MIIFPLNMKKNIILFALILGFFYNHTIFAPIWFMTEDEAKNYMKYTKARRKKEEKERKKKELEMFMLIQKITKKSKKERTYTPKLSKRIL